MPGPLLTVTISESVRRGSHAGPMLILGHGLLEIVLIMALIAGLAPFLSRTDVFIGVSLAGGILLLGMACSMLKNLPKMHLNFAVKSEKKNNLIAAGILFSLANPYWLIWWASIGLGYITHSLQLGLPGVLSFFCGHILADLAWYAVVSTVVSKGRRFCSDRAYRWVIGVCAVFLLIFAGYFLYSGVIPFIRPTA